MEPHSSETPQAACQNGAEPGARGAASEAERRAIRRRDYELVTDIDGAQWEVTERRRTKHGFTLLLGLPPFRRDLLTGGRRLIITPELFNYCQQHRIVKGAMYDLPISAPALHKLRQRLGFNYSRDIRAFWEADAEALKTLPLSEFAKRHNVSYQSAQNWRRKLHGRVRRPRHWWHSPDVLEILGSGLTRSEKALKLDISASHVFGLIRRARALTAQDKAA